MNALVVLNYNDYETTIHFVKTMQEYSCIDKIVVVDNKSTDNSFEFLLALKSKKVDVIQNAVNKGYASGNNYGVEYILNKYIIEKVIIANPDIEIEEASLSEMLFKIDKLDDVGIVSCKMICTSKIYLPIAWKLPKYIDCVLENLFILKKIFKISKEYHLKYWNQDIKVVDVLPGSFFIANVKAFKAIQGFDEDTFLYYEENILAYKLKQKGYKNYLFTNIEYIHKHSVTINKNITSVKERLEISQQSREIYCRKYLHISNMKTLFLKLSFKIGAFDYLLALKFLKNK